MNNYTTLSYLVKREICKFSEKISKKLKRPERKVVTNMLYGLSESQSCHLSKIARASKEDITKPCSNKMEYLSKVRDGSTGEIEKGYLTLEIAALTRDSKVPISVYDKVFSSEEESFVSEEFFCHAIN